VLFCVCMCVSCVCVCCGLFCYLLFSALKTFGEKAYCSQKTPTEKH
jgi:hypothetical protein